MSLLDELPEVTGWRLSNGLVRIPPGLDVPLTPRARHLIDTAEFRRLTQISQLGLVSLVYPAANHTRQEHSLGVYRVAIDVLVRLAADQRFTDAISPPDARLFLATALLHDIGHWPFCHPLEDIDIPGVPTHEEFARRFIADGAIADILREEWNIEPADVLEIVAGTVRDRAARIVCSLVSGPIDVDKIDYLMRDSLHAGVPYGQNFDVSRLIASLCLNAAGDGLAITEKGKTAAEMMVFARYVMFSEVYWHHAVRAATAMLQRAFYLLHKSLDLDALFVMTERPFVDALLKAAGTGPASQLLLGLFGPTRRLYKRVAQYSYFEDQARYQQLARRPYPWLSRLATQLAQLAGAEIGTSIAPHEILVDAPPVGLEVEFDMDVYFHKQTTFRPLGEISPVVRTLAREQFDDYVKRVRIFAHPRLGPRLRDALAQTDIVDTAIEAVESEQSATTGR